jgi:YidC/Oxa1 family membrane protein insertase
MQQKNFLTFLALAFLLLLLWLNIKNKLWGPAQPPDKQAAAEKKEGDKKPGDKAADKGAAPVVAALPPAPQETGPGQLIRLVSKGGEGRFPLQVTLDPLGAGVHEIIAGKFQEADERGLPVWEDEKKKEKKPLALVPAGANRDNPSYLFYHFNVNDPNDDKPVDTLGRTRWKVLGDKDNPVVEDMVEKDGVQRRRLRVSFQAEAQGVQITKTYTLAEGDYHLGLEIKLALAKGAARDVKFRYQMTGAHGLPVEGKWYTSIFRNALIGQESDKGGISRDLQTLQQISLWGGGNEVRKLDGYFMRYAGVAVQYFASVIVVDDDQPGGRMDILSRARPTLEKWVAKGKVKSVSQTADGGYLVLVGADRTEQTFLFRDKQKFAELRPGDPVALIVRTGSYDEKTKSYPEVALDFRDEAETHALWEDDITVRVVSEPVDLTPGKEAVHKYLLYNGPVKVMLLGQKLGREQMARPELVSRYVDKLHLDTLTDYPSPGLGNWFNKVTLGAWTLVLVKCTNFMHWVLGLIHEVIGSYGLCIIVLTILVRGLMFPISRKQAMTTMRMQALAPELKKLQEKYKDDRQGMGLAQMELYRKHGVNPFGTCWFLLLQMPIFMGLYFALQESIHFRLAPFWPLWIKNLAAPDMLFGWSESIPFVSRVQDYGGFLYLGPYFNLLPVVAVALMIAQQKMMTPPPADDQQAMQQKMMKYMMVFFGLMFYKVAAGLCVYFIASSVWGFCERKLLPKTKVPAVGETSAEGLFQKMLKRPEGPAAAAPATAVAAPGNVTPGPGKRRKPGRNKRRPGAAGREERGGAQAGTTVAADGSALQKFRAWCRGRREALRDWWADVLEQAQKRGR